ncbi:hypothetical protein [Nostocoides veronense]|uniref:Uncharacterized protein n=1 Tax=Nostocoides veronense TaxID=330836 RepID=A0ABN2LND5_9MICO
MPYRRLTSALIASAGIAGAVALSAPAHAADFSVGTVTYCSKGSVVTLTATPGSGRIAVTLDVNGSGSGNYWTLGMVDNFTGVYGGTKRADANGDVRVSAETADQAGTDNFGASAFNWRTGEVCAATLPV